MYLQRKPLGQRRCNLGRGWIAQLVQQMLDILGKMRRRHVLHILVERKTKACVYNKGQKNGSQYEK
jgi:hypothetical protein